MANARVIAGGSPTAAAAQASADQTSIGGNGTARDPFHVIGDGSRFTAPPQASGAFSLGMPVVADRPSDDLIFTKCIATSLAVARCTGLIVGFTPGVGLTTQITEQSSGIVELTAAEWDAIAGTTGGLVTANVYFVSAATAGHLTSTPPVAAGSYVTQVGFALSATKMQLQLAPPVGPHS